MPQSSRRRSRLCYVRRPSRRCTYHKDNLSFRGCDERRKEGSLPVSPVPTAVFTLLGRQTAAVFSARVKHQGLREPHGSHGDRLGSRRDVACGSGREELGEHGSYTCQDTELIYYIRFAGSIFSAAVKLYPINMLAIHPSRDRPPGTWTRGGGGRIRPRMVGALKPAHSGSTSLTRPLYIVSLSIRLAIIPSILCAVALIDDWSPFPMRPRFRAEGVALGWNNCQVRSK